MYEFESDSIEKNDLNKYRQQLEMDVQSLIEEGLFSQAKQVVEAYENKISGDISIYSIKGVIAIMEGQLLQAEEILLKGLEIDDNNYDLNYNLGYLYELQGSFKNSIEYYRKARNLLNIDVDYNDFQEVVAKIKILSKFEQYNNKTINIDSKYIQQPSSEADIESNRNNFYNSLNKASKFTATIVVWAYNRIEKTRNCVESILKWTDDIDYELILIDHGSTDETLEYFKSVNYKDKLVVEINKNIGGFGGKTVSSIIENRDSKYLVVIPNDVYVTPNWLTNLLRCMESDSKIGWVMPASTNVSNLQEVNVKIDSLEELYEFSKLYNKSDSKKWEKRMRLVNVLTIFKREIIDMIGRYDSGFFHDFGEDDYSMRLRRNGYSLIFCGDTFVHHDHNFRELEDKNKEEYATSLEIGRQNFKDKYYGIDAWEDILNFERDMINSIVEKRNTFDSNNVLGIDVRCGTPILELENAFRKLGINNIDISAYTTNAKYFQDLQIICGENKVVCDRIEYIQDNLNKNYDCIILGEYINHYKNPLKLLKSCITLLNKGGIVGFKIDNSSNNFKNKTEIGITSNSFIKNLQKQNYKIVTSLKYISKVSKEEEQLIKNNLKKMNRYTENAYQESITKEYLVCIEK